LGLVDGLSECGKDGKLLARERDPKAVWRCEGDSWQEELKRSLAFWKRNWWNELAFEDMGAGAVEENEARSVAQALLHAHIAEEHVNSALFQGERMWWHSVWVKCVKVLGGDHVDIVAWIENDVVNGMSYNRWSGQAAEDCFVELHGAGAGRREDDPLAHAKKGGFVYLMAIHLSDKIVVSA